jgi:hypothetical protein
MADIPIFGKDYPLIGPSEFTLGELNDGENFFGADFGDDSVNARKLSAILFVSVRRVEPSVTAKDIRDLTAADLEVIREALAEWQKEGEDEKVPPPADAGEPSSSVSASNGSAEIAPASDPSPSGDQTSGTGLASVRAISAS